jgi:hypothetical protein
LKQIVDYLQLFWRAHFDGFFVAALGVFLAISLFLRYAWGYAPVFQNQSWAIGKGVLFYAAPYFFTVLLYSIVYQKVSFWFAVDFWLLSLLIILVLYVNQYGLYYQSFIPKQGVVLSSWLDKIGYNLHAAFFYLLIPLFYGWYKGQIFETRFYGSTLDKFSFLPYLWLFLWMLPLLIWASYQVDFIKSYPRYLPVNQEDNPYISSFQRVILFEISYVLQFFALEVFFRGFMVMALGKFLGAAAVYPMVAVYCFLHFFKPMPEALGSIFGGLILGIIAYYSRSVAGGVLIHVAIALTMELLAFGQWYRLNKGK